MAIIVERIELGQISGQIQGAAQLKTSPVRAWVTAANSIFFDCSVTSPVNSVANVPEDLFVRLRFGQLVKEWRRDTALISSVTRTSMHPAYQAIIGMGKPVLPLVFEELQHRGGHWLWALRAITQQDPATGIADFDEARRAWLTWGRLQGHIR
jgi:hypothetical protein